MTKCRGQVGLDVDDRVPSSVPVELVRVPDWCLRIGHRGQPVGFHEQIRVASTIGLPRDAVCCSNRDRRRTSFEFAGGDKREGIIHEPRHRRRHVAKGRVRSRERVVEVAAFERDLGEDLCRAVPCDVVPGAHGGVECGLRVLMSRVEITRSEGQVGEPRLETCQVLVRL